MSPLPLSVDGHHVLVLPEGSDLLGLASAWFPQASWVRAPVTAAQARSRARPMSGARFRGMVTDVEPQPGELRLTWDTGVRGPYPVQADAAAAVGLPARPYDLWAVVPVDAPGPAQEPQVLAWMSAAARRSAGAILPADRTRALVPDPWSSVDLTLWSPAAIAPEGLVPLVRPLLSGARVSVSAGSAGTAAPSSGSPGPYEVVAAYEYDGEVRVRFGRAEEVPVVLTGLDLRDYGPFAYRVGWLPPEDGEYPVDALSPLHTIARGRLAPFVARTVAALARTAGGAVVDTDGYLVGTDELDARSCLVHG